MLQIEVSNGWKIVEFQKDLIKMKNCKTFYEARTARRPKEFVWGTSLRKLFSLSPTHSHLWNKNFLTEKCRNTQIFAIKELQEYSSWASRNVTVKMFFLTPNRNMFAGKFAKSFSMFKWFQIFNVNRVQVREISEAFWVKLYCKMSDLFC